MGGMIHVRHDSDPKQDVIDRVGDVSAFKIFPHWVLVGIYQRPERSKGGIIVPDKVLREDKFQGKVGLVLKLGEHCFEDDDRIKFYGHKAQVGDWVIFKTSETWPLDLNSSDSHCRLVADSDIRISGDFSPDQVW